MSTAAIPRAGTDAGAGPAGVGPLRLGRPTGRAFPRRRPAELAGLELRFMTDFLGAFGERPDRDLYARGGGNGFISMAGALLDGLERPLPELDHVLLAYHVPDMKVVEVAGCYLAERCPGDPEVFSVSGQGVGGAFTALRVLQGLRLGGRGRHGAVLVLDQSTLPYPDPDIEVGRSRDCAVLLRTEDADATDAVEVDFLTEHLVEDPNEVVEELVRARPEARIVVGRMLADRLDPRLPGRGTLAEGPPDRLCTSAWTALGEHWSSDRYTVVADYDPYSGRLFQAGLRPGAAP
jgi:hypothetical protein